MSRCGCAESCSCVVTGSDCIQVGGNGNPAAPLQIDLIVDPALDNQLSCGLTGAYVPPSSVEVADTDCIDLAGTGFPGDPITAATVISADADNLVECVASPSPNPGLRALLTHANSNCIDLGGAGTIADPLTASPIISPDLNNVVECRPNGLYAPLTISAAMERATIERVANQIIPASAGAGATAVALIQYDTNTQDTAGFVDNSLGWLRFIIPPGLEGYYLMILQERDESTATNTGLNCGGAGTCAGTDVTVNAQLLVNGVPVVTMQMDRIHPTQKVLCASRQMNLIVGDIIEANFGVVSQAGATAPHTLTGGLPAFLQIVRLSA